MQPKIEEKKILKNAFYYTISNIITLIISFLSVTVLTYILNPTEYGAVNFYTSTVSMLTIILSVSISSSISRYYYDKQTNYRSYVKSICLFIFIFNGILLPFFLLFSKEISSFLNIDIFLYYLIIIGSYIGIFLDFYETHLFATQNAKMHMIFKTIPLLLNTVISIFLILMLKNTNGGFIRIITIMIINFLFLLYIFFKNKSLLKEKAKLSNVKVALIFSLPLVLHSLSNYVLTYFDKLVINQYGNLASTGMYSLATKIGEVLLLVINSLNYSWAPVFYQNNGDYTKVENIIKKYAQFIFFVCIIIIFYSENAVKLIVGSDFYDSLSIIPILCLGYLFVFLYQLYVNYAIYRKKTINITINTILAAILNIVLNYIFVPKFGYKVAAYTTLVSYFVLFLLHYCNSKYILKGKVYKLTKLKSEFIYLILALVIYVFTKICFHNVVIIILIRTIFIVYLLIKYDIINMLKKILTREGE